MTSLRRVIVALLLVLSPPPTMAQDEPKPFKAEELEQLVAPIALHPDSLLVQLLMASTYPLEVVQAARFVKENSNLKGDQLNQALQQYQWDDSVKSLVTFPQVITMMNDKLDWLQKLGDAFLAQQAELMAAVQRLRARAHESGQLKSNAQQNVVVEPSAAVASQPSTTAAQTQPASPVQVVAPPATVQVVQAPPTVIKIEPTNPQVVAVPAYDPVVVYGAWPYPAYPPYYPYPPGYFAAGAMMFGAGVAVGAAMWGNADWNGGEININNQTANNFTNNVNNKSEAKARVENRSSNAGSGTAGQNKGNWKHNPDHRKGVQYRDKGSQERFNKTGPGNAQSREAFRGRSGQGGDFNRAGQQGGAGTQGQRGGQAGTSDRASGGGGDRGGAQASPRSGGMSEGGGRQAGAFEGMGGGRDTQSFSDRGRSSRESYNRSSSGSGGGGGGGRSGGGGRGGGGGRR
jgi:uncharacterized protein DUF3300